MRKAKLKNITLDKDTREIIIKIDAKDSVFIEEPKNYGFPQLVNGAVLTNGIPYLLDHDFDAVKTLKNGFKGKKGDSDKAELMLRVKQLLSAIDYEKVSEFQAKCILLVERELKKNEQ
jgi:hypothetical protein